MGCVCLFSFFPFLSLYNGYPSLERLIEGWRNGELVGRKGRGNCHVRAQVGSSGLRSVRIPVGDGMKDGRSLSNGEDI